MASVAALPWTKRLRCPPHVFERLGGGNTSAEGGHTCRHHFRQRHHFKARTERPRALHAPHGPVVPHNHARNAVGRTIEGDTRHTRIIRGEEKVPRMSCGVEVRGVGIILGGERLLIVRFLC